MTSPSAIASPTGVTSVDETAAVAPKLLSGNKRKTPASLEKLLTTNTPPKQKPLTVYMRFKKIILANSTKEEIGDLTPSKYAQKCFAEVQQIVGVENVKDERIRLLYEYKVTAQSEEQADKQAFHDKLCEQAQEFSVQVKDSCQGLLDTAESLLFLELKDALEKIQSALLMWDAVWPSTVEKVHAQAWQAVQAKHESLAIAHKDELLVAFLQTASPDALLAHATKFRLACEAQARLTELELAKQRLEEEKKRVHLEQISRAGSIPNEIAKNLQKQMVYIQGIKYNSKQITYSRGGATPEIFAAAFEVAVGTKRVVKNAYDLGIRDKPLRYGAYLSCGAVAINLSGETIHAKAHYGMDK